jgi:hypothetical protein
MHVVAVRERSERPIVVGMPFLGFGMGRWLGSIGGVDKYVTILVLRFFIPGIPTLIHIWRDNREKLFDLFRTRVLRQKPVASPLCRPNRQSRRTTRTTRSSP